MVKLYEFLKQIGVELLPWQKLILEQLWQNKEAHIIYPYYSGRVINTNKYIDLLKLSGIPIYISSTKSEVNK